MNAWNNLFKRLFFSFARALEEAGHGMRTSGTKFFYHSLARNFVHTLLGYKLTRTEVWKKGESSLKSSLVNSHIKRYLTKSLFISTNAFWLKYINKYVGMEMMKEVRGIEIDLYIIVFVEQTSAPNQQPR